MPIKVRYDITLPNGTIEHVFGTSTEDCIQKAFLRGRQWEQEQQAKPQQAAQ